MTETLPFQAALFAGALILVSVSSYVLTDSLEKMGARFGFSEGLLGIVTALGADTPEITSAITALMAGHNELGIGVVLGSNIFNLAALLGLSAILAGVIRPGREGLFLDGGVAMLVTLGGAALIAGLIPAWLGALGLGMVLAPYVWISSLRPTQVQRMKLPAPVRKFLSGALADVRDESEKTPPKPHGSPLEMLVMVPSIFAIIAGCQGLVSSTIWIAARLHFPHAIAGMLIIAALTGIPNAIAATHLALHRRGAAVVSESFNSNTLNIVAGICLPALIVGLGKASTLTVFALCWLAGMTAVAIALTARRDGIRRIGGGILVGLYAAFAVAVILWH